MSEKVAAKRQLGVLDLAHRWLTERVCAGDVCIDATCGRGNDTRLLCSLTGSVPEVGAEADFCGFRLTVMEVREHIASKILVTAL